MNIGKHAILGLMVGILAAGPHLAFSNSAMAQTVVSSPDAAYTLPGGFDATSTPWPVDLSSRVANAVSSGNAPPSIGRREGETDQQYQARVEALVTDWERQTSGTIVPAGAAAQIMPNGCDKRVMDMQKAVFENSLRVSEETAKRIYQSFDDKSGLSAKVGSCIDQIMAKFGAFRFIFSPPSFQDLLNALLQLACNIAKSMVDKALAPAYDLMSDFNNTMGDIPLFGGADIPVGGENFRLEGIGTGIRMQMGNGGFEDFGRVDTNLGSILSGSKNGSGASTIYTPDGGYVGPQTVDPSGLFQRAKRDLGIPGAQ